MLNSYNKGLGVFLEVTRALETFQWFWAEYIYVIFGEVVLMDNNAVSVYHRAPFKWDIM